MKKSILLWMLLYIGIIPVNARNYYVDIVNGSDLNTGTSPESAWKTVKKVNETNFESGDVISFRAGQMWRESLRCQSGEEGRPLTYTRYGGGSNPVFTASVDLCFENSWFDLGNNVWYTIPKSFSTGRMPGYADVGNIILTRKGENGKKAAWKRWGRDELTAQGDFYHDTRTDTLYFWSEKNPALLYSEMEGALKRNIFSISRCKHLILDGLTAAYSGAHGAAGEYTSHCTIRNCSFLWIGGSHLYTRNGRPTRYGNGIEFWTGAMDNLVENNYFEQIYDVAMTNQGPDSCLVKNIVWRNNKIFLCEQAYEFWLSNPRSKMQNVVFEYNECIDSGFGWSHEQRPDKMGTHILAYSMQSEEFDIYYRYNIFNNAVNTMIFYSNSRLPEAHFENNRYIQKGKECDKVPMFRWGKMKVAWKEYREITGNDKNSTFTCE